MQCSVFLYARCVFQNGPKSNLNIPFKQIEIRCALMSNSFWWVNIFCILIECKTIFGQKSASSCRYKHYPQGLSPFWPQIPHNHRSLFIYSYGEFWLKTGLTPVTLTVLDIQNIGGYFFPRIMFCFEKNKRFFVYFSKFNNMLPKYASLINS